METDSGGQGSDRKGTCLAIREDLREDVEVLSMQTEMEITRNLRSELQQRAYLSLAFRRVGCTLHCRIPVYLLPVAGLTTHAIFYEVTFGHSSPCACSVLTFCALRVP